MDKYEWITVILVAMILLIVIATTLPVFTSPRKRRIYDKDIVYYDRYLEIYPDYMILNGFYLGPLGRKKIPFESVSAVKMITLNIWKGRYRIQGTGDFKTWFTHDLNRPSKKALFIMHRDRKWWRIAFSAENVKKVAAIFESRGLLIPPELS